MPLFVCHSRNDIPRDLVNYNRKDLERKYVRIATDYSHESSRASCQILLNECSIPNTKALITLGYYGLLNPQLSVLNKTNILQMFAIMSKVRDYNTLLVYKSGVLRALFKYAMVLKTGRRYCFNKKIPQTEIIRFSEYVVHVLEEFANYNSFDALIIDGVPPGVKKLCQEAKSIKTKLIKRGIKFTMDSWETPYHRNVSMNTMGGSNDMVVVKPFPEKLRELQDDLSSVEVQMTQHGLFEQDSQAEESVISDLISSLSLYEYRAQNLIQESVDTEQMEHYDDTVNLLDYIKHLINLLKTKICISLDPNYIETHLSEAHEFEQFVTISSAEEPHESNSDERNIEINLQNQDQSELSDSSTEFFDSASDEEELDELLVEQQSRELEKEVDGRIEYGEDREVTNVEIVEEVLEKEEEVERDSYSYIYEDIKRNNEQLSPVKSEEDSEEKLDLLDTYKLLDYQDSTDNSKTNLNRSLLSTVDELVSLRLEGTYPEQFVSDTSPHLDGKHVVFGKVVIDTEEYSEETETEDEEIEESEYEKECDKPTEGVEEVVNQVTDNKEYDIEVLEEDNMYPKDDYLDDELVDEDEDDTFSDKKDLYLFEKEFSKSNSLLEKSSLESFRIEQYKETYREDSNVESEEDIEETEQMLVSSPKSSSKEQLDEEKLFWGTEQKDSSYKTSLFSVMTKSKSVSLEDNGRRDSVESLENRDMDREDNKEKEKRKEKHIEMIRFKDVKEMVEKIEKKNEKVEKPKVIIRKEKVIVVDKETERKKEVVPEKVEKKKIKMIEEKEESKEVEKIEIEEEVERESREKVESKDKLEKDKGVKEKTYREERSTDEKVEDEPVKHELVLQVNKENKDEDDGIRELYSDMSYVMNTLRRINNYLESKPPKFVANSKNYQNLQLSSSRSLSFDNLSFSNLDRNGSLERKENKNKEKITNNKDKIDTTTTTSMNSQDSLESRGREDMSKRLSRDELQLRKIENELQLELGEQFLEKERQLKQQLFGNIDDNLFKRLSSIYLPKKNLPMTSTVLPYDNSFVTSTIASSNHPQYNIINNYYSTTHSPRNYYSTTNSPQNYYNTSTTTHSHGPTNYYSTSSSHTHSHSNGSSHNYYTTNTYPTNYNTCNNNSSTSHNYYYIYDDSAISQMKENERSDGKGIHRDINKSMVVFKKGIPSDNLRNRLLTNYERLEKKATQVDDRRPPVRDTEREYMDNRESRRALEYDRDQEFNTNNSIVLEPSSELKQLNKLTKLLSLDNSDNNENEKEDNKEKESNEVEKVQSEDKLERSENKNKEKTMQEKEKDNTNEEELEKDKETKEKTYREERSTDENGYPVIDLSEFEILEESEIDRGIREEMGIGLDSLETEEYKDDRKEREYMDTEEDSDVGRKVEEDKYREKEMKIRDRRKGTRLESRKEDRDMDTEDSETYREDSNVENEREKERKEIRKSRDKKERRYREYKYPQEEHLTHHYYKRSVHHNAPYSPNRYSYYDSRYEDRDSRRMREDRNRYYEDTEREYMDKENIKTKERRSRKDRDYERRERDVREYARYVRREHPDRDYRDRYYYENNYRRTPVRDGYPGNEPYYVVEPNSSNEPMYREHRGISKQYDRYSDREYTEDRRQYPDREYGNYRDRRVVEVNDSNSSLSGRNMEYDREDKVMKMGKYVQLEQEGDNGYKSYLIKEGQSDLDKENNEIEEKVDRNDLNLTPKTTFRTTFRSESLTSNRTEDRIIYESQNKREGKEEYKDNKKGREEYEDNREDRETEREYMDKENIKTKERDENVDNMMVTNSNVVKNVIKSGGDVIFEDKMMTIRFTQSPVYHPGNSSYMQTEHNYTMSTDNVLTFENNSLFSYSLSFDYSNFENFPLDIKFLNKKFTGVELVPGQKVSHRFSADCFGPFVGLPKLSLTAHIDVQTDRVFQVYLPLAVSCFFTPSMDMFRLSKSYFNSDKFKHIMRNKVYFNAPKRMSLGQVMEIVTGFGKFKLLQQAESCYYLASSFSAPFYFGTKELYRFTIFAMVEVSTSHYHVHVSSDSYRLANSTSMLLKYILQN